MVRLLRPTAAIAPADCTVETIADEFRVRVTVRALLPAANAVDPTDPAARVEITEASLGVLDGPGTGLARIYNRVVFEPVPKTDAHELALGEAEGRTRIKVVPREEMTRVSRGE